MTYELHNGDCLDILPTLPAQSIDAVICDPPYGTTSCKWDSVIPFEPMWRELKRLIKPRGAIVLFGSQPFTSALVMSNPKWFKYDWIWDKHTPTGFLNAKKMPLRSHEEIVVFSQGATAYNPQKWLKPYVKDPSKPHRTGNGFTKAGQAVDRPVYREMHQGSGYRDAYSHPKSVIRLATGNGWDKKQRVHPTQKPLALLEYLVKTYTNEDDTVLDFAFGSGTTGHACGNLGRRFVGIEKDAGYFAVAAERIAAAYAPLAHMERAS